MRYEINANALVPENLYDEKRALNTARDMQDINSIGPHSTIILVINRALYLSLNQLIMHIKVIIPQAIK
jgi:hypothetical protein